MSTEQGYFIPDLEEWNKRIEDLAASFGLDWYPQEFELVDDSMIMSTIAYSGMPSHYPHWSFGKAYERQKTLYKYGMGGLPYELVINSNPSIAYLMDTNPLALQILTMSHVYGHNDFFKNNINFRKGTRAELALEFFRASADRVRSYISDPSIGAAAVEEALDCAHALMYNCPRVPGTKYVSQEEQRKELLDGSKNVPEDEWSHLSTKKVPVVPNLKRLPLKPEESLLLFLRDYSARRLEEWEKDILTIVYETFSYFMPQIMTKIMNEGWASYWHYKIGRALNLPASLRVSLANFHSMVVRSAENPFVINPYHLGFTIWNDIERRYENPTDEEKEKYSLKGGEGMEQIFRVRRTANDASFLEAYLTKDLMVELNLFSFVADEDEAYVDELPDDDSWKQIRQTLVRDVGMGSFPVIKVIDGDGSGARSLVLKHEFDGRHLDSKSAKKTIQCAYHFWGRPVSLETTTFKRHVPYVFSYDGEKSSQSRKK